MLSDHRVMLADFSCNEQVFYLLLKYKPRPGAGKEQERGLWWLPRTRLFLLCKAQSVSFCIPQQQVAVNRNGIALAQEAQVFGLGCAGGDGGKSDGREGVNVPPVFFANCISTVAPSRTSSSLQPPPAGTSPTPTSTSPI